MNKIKTLFKNQVFRAIVGTIIGAFLSSATVVWILDLGSFYSTGSTGLAQVISRIIDRNGNLSFLEGAIFFAINVPLVFIGFKAVSRKFAIYSALSVALQSILLIVLKYIDWNPFLEVGQNSLLLLAIMGGLVGGVASGITLRLGSSTGGTEIISQYIYVKKQGNFSVVSFAIDAVILVLAFFVEGRNVEIICYTIVRLIIYLIVIDKMHTIYKSVMLKVVSSKGNEIREALVKRFNHGITMYKAEGGYSHVSKDVLEIAMASHEINEYRHIIRKIDRDAFITTYHITKIDGYFNHNVMG